MADAPKSGLHVISTTLRTERNSKQTTFGGDEMKTAVWTKPRRFEIQSVEEPKPIPGEVVIRVKHAGICGSDLSGFLGENSLRKPPLIMGHEFAGEVVEVGAGVEAVQLGDTVTVNPLISCGRCASCRSGLAQYCAHKQILGIHRPGAFAEFIAVPAQSCHIVSDTVLGALVEPLACSIRAVRQARVGLGDNVVVIGAGIIGLFALRMASVMGAGRRILIDTNEERLQVGTAFGATDTIHAFHTDVVQAAAELTGAQIHRVIDAVGLSLTRKQSVQMLQPGGRAVWIGLHEEAAEIHGNVVVRNEIEVVGSFCYSDDDFRKAHSFVEQRLTMENGSWIDIRPLDMVEDCFLEQIEGPGRFPKLILSM